MCDWAYIHGFFLYKMLFSVLIFLPPQKLLFAPDSWTGGVDLYLSEKVLMLSNELITDAVQMARLGSLWWLGRSAAH